MRERGRGRRPAGCLPTSGDYLLDRVRAGDIRAARDTTRRLLELHWKYYSELAFQRWNAREPISAALREAAAGPYPFKRWQRVTPLRWSLEPLSSNGSLSEPGGRFNIGAVADTIPKFPALYLAQDKNTALAETLSADPAHVQKQDGIELSSQELCLSNPSSITVTSVSGQLESCIDLTGRAQGLRKVVDILRTFTLGNDLQTLAQALGLPPLGVLTRHEQLMSELLRADWRTYPIQLDVPSNSQIFGRMVLDAGISGIVYPSRHTGSPCLALFPGQLANSSTYVELDDTPPPELRVRRLDGGTPAELR